MRYECDFVDVIKTTSCVVFDMVFYLVNRDSIATHTAMSSRKLINQNYSTCKYSINNRQGLTYQKNAHILPVVFLTKIMETTLFSPPCITLSQVLTLNMIPFLARTVIIDSINNFMKATNPKL